MAEIRNAYGVLIRKPDGKKWLERNIHRWEDNIILDLKEIAPEGVNWNRWAQNSYQWQALLNTAMKPRIP
jgi:hypothetical protein